MGIEFTQNQWDRVKENYSLWWEGKLDRPLISVVLKGKDQCDFSYMISPEMFDEFCRPELEATCRRLGRSIYHLDGVGQLPHLNSILEIEDLDGVQWVPGDGKPPQSQWPEVYEKIHRAGKNSQLWDGFDGLDNIIAHIGSGKGIHHTRINGDITQEDEMRKRLALYHK